MNEIEVEVAQRVRANVAAMLDDHWRRYWREANEHRGNGKREASSIAAQKALAVNAFRNTLDMLDVSELLVPAKAEEAA